MAKIQFINDMVNDMMSLLAEIESGKLNEKDRKRKTIEMCTIFRYVGSYIDKDIVNKIEQYNN